MADMITVEEFYELPYRDDAILELRFGTLFEAPRPKPWRVDLQHKIAWSLKERCDAQWTVRIGMPFRALLEYELRRVDVGVVAKSRWDQVGRESLLGSPEIVIEILSPPTPEEELLKRAALFLNTGTQQYCLINEEDKTIIVIDLGQVPLLYRAGDEVPFPLLGTSIKISEIWSE
jgi:Uma2 family endonuclease